MTNFSLNSDELKKVRPPVNEETGLWLVPVTVSCIGLGCNEMFNTNDPKLKRCQNCRRRIDPTGEVTNTSEVYNVDDSPQEDFEFEMEGE